MNWPDGQELSEFANALIHSRQHVSPRRLNQPAPSPLQLRDILAAAGAAPDHERLMPWRFVVVPPEQRERLANVFGAALIERDPNATPAQINNAREKAYRAPFLMLAVARLTGPLIQSHMTSQAEPGHSGSAEAEVNDAERLVSLGCAVQNIVLSAHAAGFGTGITSGQALASKALRALFALRENEQAICCINIGTVTKHKPPRLRPGVADYICELDGIGVVKPWAP